MTPGMTQDSEVLANQVGRLAEQALHVEPVAVKKKSRLQKYADKILGIPGFDSFMGIIIMVNLIAMIVEIDQSASEEEEPIDGGMHWTELIGWVILCVFVVELVLRLIALRYEFWKDSWNIGDFIIVVTDLFFSVVGLVAGDVFPVSILRVFRLSKLARVSKLTRVFPELKMLLVGLVHSVKAVFWGTTLLSMFLLVWSMVAVLVIHPLNKNIDYGDCKRCSQAFSSVKSAFLTLFQQIVAGDSWGQVTLPLLEQHPITALIFLPAFLSVGLCVMNLMLAVVVSASQTAYEHETQDEEAKEALQHVRSHSNLLELCQTMDADNSGELSWEEVLAGFKAPGELREALLGLGITEDDFAIAWSIIDVDGSGSVSYKEFVTSLLSMKSSSQHFVLIYIKNYVTWIRNSLSKQMELQLQETREMESNLQKTMERVEREEEVIFEDVDLLLGQSKQWEPDEKQNTSKDAKCGDTVLDKLLDRDAAGRHQPHVHKDTCSGEGATLATVRRAMQDLMQRISDDACSQHLALKDILMEMERNVCQRIPGSSSLDIRSLSLKDAKVSL